MFGKFMVWSCLPLGVLNLVLFITDGQVVNLIIGFFCLAVWALNMYLDYKIKKETEELNKLYRTK